MSPMMFVVLLDMEIIIRCIFLQVIKISDNKYRGVLETLYNFHHV